MGISDNSPAFTIINGTKWAYLKRGNGRNILCRENEYALYETLERKATVNFHSLFLHKQVMGLSADTGSMRNLFNRLSSLKRKLKLEGGAIHYEMRGGDVLLTQLEIDFDYKAKNASGMGLHLVSGDNSKWITKPIGRITTTHAAINGTTEGIQKAAKLMPDFINHAYPQEQLGNNASYTLFHNSNSGAVDADWKCIQDSTGMFGGSDTARELAAAIELAAKENRPVNWTVHERGCAIWKQAIRLVNTSNQHDYSQQTVFYANPVVNLELLDQQRKRVGMQLAKSGFVSNGMSLHQGLVAGNWISEPAMLWQMGNKGGAITKTVGRATKVATAITAPAVLPSLIGTYPGLIGAASWAVGMFALLGTNLAAQYTNQGIIKNSGDAINHYFFKKK